MAYGFVYVLANDAMPGIYKVGMTTKPPFARMDELSAATACPEPFWLAMFAQVEDPAKCERDVHIELAAVRVNQSREFFRTSLREIAIALGCECGEEVHWTFDGQYKSWREDEALAVEEKTRHFFSQSADPMEWRSRGFE
jgi:hypothetical protein